MSITPSRPYLLRALHEWMSDNSLTPLVAVDATVQGVDVPQNFVQDGQINLNISNSAAQGLFIDDTAVSFSARFGGVPMQVYIPMAAILAIYARENGMGMGFGLEPAAELLISEPVDTETLGESDVQSEVSVEKAEDKPAAKDKKRPALRVVK